MPGTVYTRLIDTIAGANRAAPSLQRCWLDVSNAGGAVGLPFLPVSEDAIQRGVQRLLDDVAAKSLVVFVAERDDELLGWVLLRLNASDLTRHWATVERLQSRPEHRNEGVGIALMKTVTEHAQTVGLEQLRLTLRGGEHLEAFYSRLGWNEIGRHSGALRLADGDDRDEVMMARSLPATPATPVRPRITDGVMDGVTDGVRPLS
nr:hypothetical protein [uncultured bacterium]